MGFFYRTIRIVENGIKPAYVFDGKPPELKSGVVHLSLFYGRPRTNDTIMCCSYLSGLKGVKRPKRKGKRLRKQVRDTLNTFFRHVITS